jgi:hypothetical protein
MQLNRNRYLLENTVAETCMSYDDPNRLAGWLIGKKSFHLIVHVIKGDKSKLMLVPQDLTHFHTDLNKAMQSL